MALLRMLIYVIFGVIAQQKVLFALKVITRTVYYKRKGKMLQVEFEELELPLRK